MVAAILGAIYLIAQPLSADHAAQVFRSGLFESEGLSTWNNLWFGGHHTPGYSVIFPFLASLIGPRLVGVIAVIAAAMLFSGIAYREWGDRARVGRHLVRGGRVDQPLQRAPLLRARRRDRAGGRVRLAARTGVPRRSSSRSSAPWRARSPRCSSPAARSPTRSPSARGDGLELGVAALGAAVLITFAFPEGGTEPFVWSSFQPAILIAIAVFLAIPRDEKLLRYGVAAYAAALSGAFVLDTPMGGQRDPDGVAPARARRSPSASGAASGCG